MDKQKEKELIMGIMEIENKEFAVELLNFYERVKEIKKDMVDSLNLLDKFSENSDNKAYREKLRKSILDNFNDLPRVTQRFLKQTIKEME